MQKIIIVLVGLILILGGCNMESSVPDVAGVPLNEYYDKMDNGNYQITIVDNGTMFLLMDGDNEVGMVGEVYPTSNQTIHLEYMFDEGVWTASYINGDEVVNINPEDAYAYINDVGPAVIYELEVRGKIHDVDLTSLEGGDKTVVEELLGNSV